MNRRGFLGGCLAVAGVSLPAGIGEHALVPAHDGWDDVRASFDLDRSLVHLGGLFISSHPRPVREAIERHRRGLDRDPVGYLLEQNTKERIRVTQAAAAYWGTSARAVALTDSTTMGLSLLYHGLRLRAGDEVVRTEHDHYATWYSLDLAAEVAGATVRAIRLYDDSANDVSADELVEKIVSAVGPKTRVLALTWVHSSSGLKLPIGSVAAELQRRGLRDRVLLCVDGVHGFGAENAEMADLGCDFFVAGCHKWLHGPRGTGVVYAARPELWEERVAAVIPPFGVKHTEGLFRSPGGFHAFEHRWALAEAFAFHQEIGKPRVAARVAELASHLKEGLARIPGVRLYTPRDPSLSSGIVSFDLAGWTPQRLIDALRDEDRIVVTRSPYGKKSVRASPGIANAPEEIERLVEAVRRRA
jgi:isopenicillin-N epimerase